jgi:hypothetical protein
LYLANNTEEFGDHIEGLTSGKVQHLSAPGIAIARERSWDCNVPGLMPWIFAQNSEGPFGKEAGATVPMRQHAA